MKSTYGGVSWSDNYTHKELQPCENVIFQIKDICKKNEISIEICHLFITIGKSEYLENKCYEYSQRYSFIELKGFGLNKIVDMFMEKWDEEMIKIKRELYDNGE